MTDQRLHIKILGTGCTRCKNLKKRVDQIVNELHLDAKVEFVDDIDEMLNYGYLSVPALVINEKLVSFGIVPQKDMIIQWINEALNQD